LIQSAHQVFLQFDHITTRKPNPPQKTPHCIDRVGLGLYLLKSRNREMREEAARPGAVTVDGGVEVMAIKQCGTAGHRQSVTRWQWHARTRGGAGASVGIGWERVTAGRWKDRIEVKWAP
jgi:hypothetical protein